jgi:hypothetical protein
MDIYVNSVSKTASPKQWLQNECIRVTKTEAKKLMKQHDAKCQYEEKTCQSKPARTTVFWQS